MSKVKQVEYKPKKEKVVPLPAQPEKQVTGQDVLDYFGARVFEHRGFILLTALILSWTFFLVRS